MKQIISQLASLCLIVGMMFTLTPGAYGGPKGKKSVVHETVSAITANSITVSGKESHTYTITRDTEILVNGQRAPASAIAVGMYVMIGADSNGQASLINAQTPPQKSR
jgi:hypothetical protein